MGCGGSKLQREPATKMIREPRPLPEHIKEAKDLTYKEIQKLIEVIFGK